MLLKIAQGVFWILAVCLMPGTAYGEGRDVLPGNAAYKVEVFRGGTWEEIFVYNARVSDYAGPRRDIPSIQWGSPCLRTRFGSR